MAKKNNRQYGGAIGKAILYNRNVLYFIFFLSLGYLFYILSVSDFYTFSIFVIIGFLTSFFSKNMVVILSLAMSVSFIFKYGTNIRPEGFEEETVSDSETPPDIPPPPPAAATPPPPATPPPAAATPPPPATPPPAATSSSESSEQEKISNIRKLIDDLKNKK
jgi:hypothetical protein